MRSGMAPPDPPKPESQQHRDEEEAAYDGEQVVGIAVAAKTPPDRQCKPYRKADDGLGDGGMKPARDGRIGVGSIAGHDALLRCGGGAVKLIARSVNWGAWTTLPCGRMPQTILERRLAEVDLRL